jgi:tRNA-specific 2-thiouridylase
MRKPEVRGIARDLGLPTADKPDSQEICFVPGGDYREVVRARAGAALRPGVFLDREGRVLGEHGGAALFTVGQRRGLGLGGAGGPRFVASIDASRGAVVLGEPADLDARSVLAGGWNPVSAPEPGPGEPPLAGRAKVRRGQDPRPARARGLGGGRVRIEFEEPVRAPAPGQAAVLYDGEGWVLGGGWIESVEPWNAGPGKS